MKLVLRKDVAGLGHKDDVVVVADGYARNFLLPQALAARVTPGLLAQAERLRSGREEGARRERAEGERIRDALAATRVVIAARAGDEGRLFGSIGPADISEAVRKFTGMELDRKLISVPEPIKSIGLHQVEVRPHPEVSFELTLDVIPA